MFDTNGAVSQRKLRDSPFSFQMKIQKSRIFLASVDVESSILCRYVWEAHLILEFKVMNIEEKNTVEIHCRISRPSLCGYLSMRHIRNRLLHRFSYVRRPSESGYLSMMHIRNRLPHGISYVRRPSRSGYSSMMHIRNRLPHGISYVRRPSRSGYSSMMHIRNRPLLGISYVH